jgi:hypothetical protein
MSYLNSLRLHFAGKFQAAPSTVNNDPVHFDNRTFIPSYQKFGTGQSPRDVNGWWNPVGDAAWRLIGCRISAAWMKQAPAPASDPIHGCLIADSDRSVSAKLVDLDPEQQMVSEVWGMEIRICTENGTTLLRSHYKTAAFIDIWSRAPVQGDSAFGATYQSTLHDLEWGGIESSPFLQALRDSSVESGKLSIKFNVDGYNMNPGPDFTLGRIVGTIGPCAAGEPDHLVLGRHFMAPPQNPTPYQLNYCPAVVDAQARKIYVDLGNALPTTTPGGDIQPMGTLSLAYVDTKPESIGTIDYQLPRWYESTAGVVELPSRRALTSDELNAVQTNPLAWLAADTTGTLQAGIQEPPGGLYARADQFVFRMEPEQKSEVRVFATRFGAPLPGARIVNVFDPSGLQPSSIIGTAPAVAVPEDALNFPCRIVTGPDGIATLTLHAVDPGNPRSYIDGQVYGVRPMLEATLAYGTNYPFNPVEFISVLVFNRFKTDGPPTWYGSLQPIFVQYANLYPIMNRFLDLKDYESVCNNAKLLLLAFSLRREDPNSMPVTRDLSDAKRAAILEWFRNPGPDGKPLMGSPPPAVESRKVAAPSPAPAAGPPAEPMRGGKTAALARRLFLLRGKSLI